MATFTSIADVIGPQRIRLDSPREQSVAIDTMLALAQARVRVFDHDLADTGWGSAERERVLTAFLLASPRNRLDILLRDTGYLESRCPRLRSLQKRFSHLVSVHACDDGAMHATDPMLIVDDAHFVHRHHYQAVDAIAGLFVPDEAAPLIRRFDALWAASAPCLPPTTLGL
jgi:hypothetical protein